jgi:ribonuclease R
MRELPSDSEILRIFEQQAQKIFRLRELILALELRSSEARELKPLLKELARRGKIQVLKKGHFTLARGRDGGTSPERHRAGDASAPPGRSNVRARGLVSGRLIAHRDGYGFVVPDDPKVGADIFIPPLGMSSAMHGDRVKVHVIEKRPAVSRPGLRRFSGRDSGEKDKGLRLEGRIVTITERAQSTVVGEFRCGARFNYVLPFDRHIPLEIVIVRGDEWPSEERTRHRQFGGESKATNLAQSLSSESSAASRRDARSEPASDNRRSRQHRSARNLDGQIVDVKLLSFPDPVRGIAPRGRVIEVLGRREDFGVDVEIIIRKYHLPHRFPEDVLAEASGAPQSVAAIEIAGRRDFRALPIVTIDGETAKDFDDAVYVERLPENRYRLSVHIADVAHYVRTGSAIDREARLRGTSVYFPDRAVPMLPLELSNGICSLNPHVDRLTMSALMEIDAKGHITDYELTPGVIRSAERMTYTAVHAVLRGDVDALARYAHLAHQFHLMEELALILNRRRQARGSIDFDLPAPEIEFDEQGQMIGITRSERNIAHRLIEEFMLCANDTVATHLERHGMPTLYRIHEPPDPKKVLEFEEIAASFGQSLGVELPAARRQRVHARDERDRHPRFEKQIDASQFKITSRHYQNLTERIAGKPEERILSYLMLRSLRQARYSEENVGHFALASPTYTHFTSPIRRYPDLIVHRTLKAQLAAEGGATWYGHPGRAMNLPTGAGSKSTSGGAESVDTHELEARATSLPTGAGSKSRSSGVDPHGLEARGTLPVCEGGVRIPTEELNALGLETSESERRAADAERELVDWKKVTFMSERLGDEFDALVIGLTRHGFFVELTDLFIEGFVPLESFEDDRYVYRENLRAVVGLDSKRAYHLGDRVQVRLDRIDQVDNRLEFGVVPASTD